MMLKRLSESTAVLVAQLTLLYFFHFHAPVAGIGRGVKGPFVAVADGADTFGGYAGFNQIRFYGVGPLLRQYLVFFRLAHPVSMAGYPQLQRGPGFQLGSQLVQGRAGFWQQSEARYS